MIDDSPYYHQTPSPRSRSAVIMQQQHMGAAERMSPRLSSGAIVHGDALTAYAPASPSNVDMDYSGSYSSSSDMDVLTPYSQSSCGLLDTPRKKKKKKDKSKKDKSKKKKKSKRKLSVEQTENKQKSPANPTIAKSPTPASVTLSAAAGGGVLVKLDAPLPVADESYYAVRLRSPAKKSVSESHVRRQQRQEEFPRLHQSTSNMVPASPVQSPADFFGLDPPSKSFLESPGARTLPSKMPSARSRGSSQSISSRQHEHTSPNFSSRDVRDFPDATQFSVPKFSSSMSATRSASHVQSDRDVIATLMKVSSGKRPVPNQPFSQPFVGSEKVVHRTNSSSALSSSQSYSAHTNVSSTRSSSYTTRTSASSFRSSSPSTKSTRLSEQLPPSGPPLTTVPNSTLRNASPSGVMRSSLSARGAPKPLKSSMKKPSSFSSASDAYHTRRNEPPPSRYDDQNYVPHKSNLSPASPAAQKLGRGALEAMLERNKSSNRLFTDQDMSVISDQLSLRTGKTDVTREALVKYLVTTGHDATTAEKLSRTIVSQQRQLDRAKSEASLVQKNSFDAASASISQRSFRSRPMVDTSLRHVVREEVSEPISHEDNNGRIKTTSAGQLAIDSGTTLNMASDSKRQIVPPHDSTQELSFDPELAYDESTDAHQSQDDEYQQRTLDENRMPALQLAQSKALSWELSIKEFFQYPRARCLLYLTICTIVAVLSGIAAYILVG